VHFLKGCGGDCADPCAMLAGLTFRIISKIRHLVKIQFAQIAPLESKMPYGRRSKKPVRGTGDKGIIKDNPRRTNGCVFFLTHDKGKYDDYG